MRTRKTIWTLALMATSLTTASASAQDTRERRRELEERYRQLTEELRDVQRELWQDRAPGVFSWSGPGVLTLSTNRAQLGVFVQTRSDDETDAIGAVLESVTPGGPADEAGLQAGDIVVSFNGKRLAGDNPDVDPGESGPARRLIDLVGEMDEGDDVVIEYQRDGQDHRTTATLRKVDNDFSLFRFRRGEEPMDFNFRLQPPRAPMERAEVWPPSGDLITVMMSSLWADIELVSLNEELGEYFGTSDGLLVIRAPDDDVNLRGGDVILAIDGREPRSPSRALRILRSYEPGETMSLDIMRNRQRMTVEVTVPERSSSGSFLRRREMH